ncbi:MAG: OsmC family protein [Sulfolobales archaeon]|nr:OsmC family protein [Sulfolobales archaeon]MDW8082270.1 OsmC family protein [Sulfolobales archaeon]
MSKVSYKDQQVTVVGTRASPDKPLKMVVKAGAYEIVLDKVGGEAPSPIEYLLASHAGCINIVGEIVAKDMNIKISDLKVEIVGVFNPSKLMTGVGERAGYREISVKVFVKSEASAETLREWFSKIRERCPIEDNLANPTPIKSEIVKL